jgi:WS/DGAT/MGAT family acyltransferase
MFTLVGGRFMTRLSLFDQLFYKIEKAGLPPLYMAGAMVIDPAQSPFKLTPAIVADHLAARMEAIPLMRKKIVQDALSIGSVRLVDDPKFSVRNHIYITQLPAPGGYKELTERLGSFSERRIDLNMPPWHYEVIGGLEGGKIAVAIHLHHAVMDGLGAQDALSRMYDTKPVKPERPRKRKWKVVESSAPMSLLSSALLENAERIFVKTPKYLYRSGIPLAKTLATVLTRQLRLKETRETGLTALPPIKRTSLNAGKMTPKRVVSFIELPMTDALAIRKSFECSINDLALVLNSAAIEHYFKKTREKVDFDLVCAMPMNARKEGETGPGNVLTVARVNLHNTIPNLGARLRAIAKDTAAIKAQHRGQKGADIDGRSLMDLFSPLVIDSLCFAVESLKLTSRVMLANVGITNVPGSPVTLYICGAPVVTAVPMAPVIGAVVAVTITVSSTEKYLLFGYHGDGGVIKDKELFVDGARHAFEKLKRIAMRPVVVRAPRPPAKASRRAKAAAG